MALGWDSVIFKHLLGEDTADGFKLYFEVSGRRSTVGRDGSLRGRGTRSR
jgi:hypothetical protein